MTPSLLPRRRHLLLGVGAVVLSACSPGAADASEARYARSPFRTVSDAEWRRRLGESSWRVLRHENTEHPFTSRLNDEHRRGVFHCKGCDLALFRSEWKYDSGTGWPSFHTAIRENLGVKRDLALGFPRTEYHCARCLGHQGHLFDDGPRPTGKRYCNNGVALTFKSA